MIPILQEEQQKQQQQEVGANETGLLTSLASWRQDEREEQQDQLSVTAMVSYRWLTFVLISLTGILLNCLVFWRRNYKCRRDSTTTTRISLSLLSTMAAADTLCLVGLLVSLSTRHLGLGVDLMHVVCKIDTFLIHAASAFSIWCWLVLSAVRYVAIYRPYTHLKLNREPLVAVIAVLGICCAFESYTLYDAGYVVEYKVCESVGNLSEEMSKFLNVFEIIASYFLPLSIITALDLKVLCCRSFLFAEPAGQGGKEKLLGNAAAATATPSITSAGGGSTVGGVRKSSHIPGAILSTEDTSRKVKSRRKTQQLRVLRRCLAIMVLDLSMNLPNYVYRLFISLAPPTSGSGSGNDGRDELLRLVELVSQIMYFMQFSLNALYLTIIYHRPSKKHEHAMGGPATNTTHNGRSVASGTGNQHHSLRRGLSSTTSAATAAASPRPIPIATTVISPPSPRCGASAQPFTLSTQASKHAAEEAEEADDSCTSTSLVLVQHQHQQQPSTPTARDEDCAESTN